ncbi:hypothetical protein, partial [Wohlfahrtiimonas populi]|uniref:hypothetical protein n=1 Tax=Wohlfahrtiimonas populi TaxID=1940240 RepID=UPI00117F54F5
MQRYPQKIDEQLNRVVEQSRDHLESVKLETAAMVAGHELERTAKQPEIEPQLERPVEERPIVDERQQDARQEDLNPTLNHDDRELTRQEKLEISQEKIDEIREIYISRIHEVNQELSDINATRQVEGYWEQSHEITQADNDRADSLLSQRLNLYEILDRTPDEQQAYLDNHPEFDLVLNERDYDKVQTTLDDLSETMPNAIKLEDNPDDYKVGVWDSVTESISDTARTVDAFVEVAVADGLNTGTKIGMNIGAATLGAYHGIKEGSLDEGITAMREIRDGAVENYKVDVRESSQEILSNSENLQAVGRTINEGMEWGYNKVGEHLGDEAQFIARGAMEAVGDTLAVTGVGLTAKSVARNLSDFSYEFGARYSPKITSNGVDLYDLGRNY